jgi:uncharacterized protein YbjT (DUF2867 family)
MPTPQCATLFGGTGFLGRAIAQSLAREGIVVRVPTRHPDRANVLRIAGDAGQIAPFYCSLRRDIDVAEAIGASDTVINLIGILNGRNANAFQSVHVELAARIARIARQQGVRNLLHISALGAGAGSNSCYACSKAAGEKAVRAFFPEAIIFRPGIMFGPDDRFLNRFVNMARFSPLLPLIGGGKTKFQPVYVGDVAKAALAALNNPEARWQTYELGGAAVYTFRELLEFVLKTMGKKRGFMNMPWGLAKMLAALMELFPNPPLTRDQVELLKTDNVIKDPDAKTLRDLEVVPVELEKVLPDYFLKPADS